MNKEKKDQVNEANDKEKSWWYGKGFPHIDEERLPLVLKRGVTFKQYAKKAEKVKAARFWEYSNGTVTIIELPTGEHESTCHAFSRWFGSAFNNMTQDNIMTWGAKSLYTDLGSGEYKEPDGCYVPLRLLNQGRAPNPCDNNGNPWPTIILEICSTESLVHVKDKINNYWLAPNRCEDVIVIKIGSWKTKRRDQNNRPLRRLRCLRFCRHATLQQNQNATIFDPIQVIEFGSVLANGRVSNFCNGPHMQWLTIDCNCIYAGCRPPIPSFQIIVSSRPFGPHQGTFPVQSGVAMDLYDIQQEIFNSMGFD